MSGRVRSINSSTRENGRGHSATNNSAPFSPRRNSRSGRAGRAGEPPPSHQTGPPGHVCPRPCAPARLCRQQQDPGPRRRHQRIPPPNLHLGLRQMHADPNARSSARVSSNQRVALDAPEGLRGRWRRSECSRERLSPTVRFREGPAAAKTRGSEHRSLLISRSPPIPTSRAGTRV